MKNTKVPHTTGTPYLDTKKRFSTFPPRVSGTASTRYKLPYLYQGQQEKRNYLQRKFQLMFFVSFKMPYLVSLNKVY